MMSPATQDFVPAQSQRGLRCLSKLTLAAHIVHLVVIAIECSGALCLKVLVVEVIVDRNFGNHFSKRFFALW